MTLSHLRKYLLIMAMGSACKMATPIPENKSNDAIVFKSHCIICHSLPHPGRHTLAEWHQVLRMMDDRRLEKNMGRLSRKHKKAILRYLGKHSR